MALDMSPEQKEIGKANFNRAVGKLAEDDQQQHERGVTRRRFMQGMIAAGATLPVSAAAYFGYRNHGFPNHMRPVKAALIGAGDEGGVLVGAHNPQFVEFIAVCDVRPYNKRRIFTGEASGPRTGLNSHYGSDCRRHIRVFDDYKQMLREVPDVELVVIALPLHLHAQASIDALEAGKHVLCEKLMAWNIRQCKDMIAKADQRRKLLSIGHQRHYSMLYAHANEIVRSGVLGDIKHIRALWHRNQVRPNPNADLRAQRPFLDSWWPIIPPEDRAAYAAFTDERRRELGYRDIEELIRWRLYNRTGGGLMAELGSHQLDACSIFLGKKHPLSVTAVGGKHFYGLPPNPPDDRQVEDHVYCIYEFPGKNYNRNDPVLKNDIVTVTYSSINTNDFENYGECIMGTKGTLIVEKEQTAMLWSSQQPVRSTEVTANTAGAAPVLDASATSAPSERRAGTAGQNALGTNAPSQGYREEMEHLAYCIRMQGQGMERDADTLKPRCDGRAAMADAIIALVANKAMKNKERIVFDDKWFDAALPDVPDERANG
jgi:predicted dehydrogenase